MNKRNIITCLSEFAICLRGFAIPVLALITMSGQAKTFKTIKNPVAMVHNIYGGELKAREVIMRDTATTVRFTMDYPKGQNFRFVSSSYLMDEDGNRYPMRSAEGLKLDAWVTSAESGVNEFTIHFEPMPKTVQVFDFIEGDVHGAFKLLGIRDGKTKLTAPTIQELRDAHPWQVPADWFKTDTITVKGRIEGYDAEQFGFTSMECNFEDVFEKGDATLVLDIAADGTFCKKFQASYPVQQSFHTMESKVDFYELPFYARPGETIDVTVRKNERSGQYECVYNNGSSRDAARWLRTAEDITSVLLPLGRFRGTFDEENALADKVWNYVLYRLQTVSRREHYTPMEMQLALADVETRFAEYYMAYALYRQFDLMKQEYRDGIYYTEVLDSAEWQKLFDAKNYYQLHRVDFDNPLLFASSYYPHLLSRIQYTLPIDHSKDGEITRHDNLMAQACAYKDYLNDFNWWRSNEENIPLLLADTTKTEAERQQALANMATLSKMLPVCLATFTHPYVRQKAEQYYALEMAQKDLSSPLPDTPMADLIRSLSAKYPGRFLLIDFWGMGCGPCRAAIQESKDKRAEIARRDDVKLIFIAEERTAEGSEAYHKYVSEWLADEETVCLTYADFARMQEMFRFNGIPHYETITPDGRRVRDDLRFNGLYNFDQEIKRLKDKLK